MSSEAEIVRYLRACYEADNREASILNLRHERVQHLMFLSKGGDFLRGLLDVVPIEREAALAAQKAADLYRTERSLIFGSILLRGQANGPRGRTELCAPLYLFPARVQDHSSYACLEVDARQGRVNTRALRAFAGENESAEEQVDVFLAKAPTPPLQVTDVYDLVALLEETIPGINCDSVRSFSEVALESDSLDDSGQPLAVWSHCVALIPNSPETRGVLIELNDLANARELSPPVRTLLAGAKSTARLRRVKHSSIPACLSDAQQRALQSCASHPLTVIYGPPGTGKTFTTAVIAIEHVLRGEPVLLAARTDQALDVLQEKIQAVLGDGTFVLRGGRGGHFSELKERLEKILREPLPKIPENAPGFWEMRRSVGQLEKTERALFRQIKQEEWMLPAQAKGSFWGRLRSRIAAWQLQDEPLLCSRTEEYHTVLEKHHELLCTRIRAQLLSELRSVLRRRRTVLRTLSKALRARTTTKQNELFGRINQKALFQTFPIWACTLADLHELLPFAPELFGLAILDEATQCDMASCLPAFQRAERIAITGDPKQLRHVSFLSRDRQRQLSEQQSGTTELAERFEFRDKSILDLVLDHVESHEQIIFLDEHFRSTPHIISFSNREFYDEKLKLMRSTPQAWREQSVQFRKVEGARSESGVNKGEAEALMDDLLRLVEEERGKPQPSSMGILSPFRDQVDYLERLIQKRVGLADIERHQVRLGTAYSFQGEERDVMFISLALDAASHPTAFRYLNRADVFNVSITRARTRQILYHSFQAADSGNDTLAGRYLAQDFKWHPPQGKASKGFSDSIKAAFAKEELAVWENFPLGGCVIDLVLEANGRCLGLDLIHSGNEALDLEKYRTLERSGFRVFPVSLREWELQEPAIVSEIKQWLGCGVASAQMQKRRRDRK